MQLCQDIEPASIEFPYICVAINENSNNLVACKAKYDSHGEDIFEMRLVSDLLFSQLYFVEQSSDYIVSHIDESTEHTIIKQHLEQFLQSMNTSIFFLTSHLKQKCMLFLLQDIKVGDIVYFEDVASESNGLYSGYAIVTVKDDSKANQDYNWNIDTKKDLIIRAINIEIEELASVQNSLYCSTM